MGSGGGREGGGNEAGWGRGRGGIPLTMWNKKIDHFFSSLSENRNGFHRSLANMLRDDCSLGCVCVEGLPVGRRTSHQAAKTAAGTSA